MKLLSAPKQTANELFFPRVPEERTLKAANQILTDGVADLIIPWKTC